MKLLLIAAALACLPGAVQAQVAAGTVPDPFQRQPAAPAAPPAPAASPSQPPLNAAAPATLRTLIEGAQAGGMDYSLLTDDLAGKVRVQQEAVATLLQSLGELQNIEFVGSEDGVDLFAVTFARGLTHWIIGFDESDKVAVLLFRQS